MANAIIPTDIGDRELGSVVPMVFSSVDPATGAPASMTGATFRIVELQTNAVYTGVAIVPDLDLLGTTGLHRVQIDTSDAFFRNGVDYVLSLTAGTVGGVDQTGAVCGTFSIGIRSDGLVHLRAVKCHSGTVTSVGVPNDRVFRINFTGVEDTVNDFYARQEFAFQSGTNAGVGQVCLSYDAANKEVLVQEPYPTPVEVGAKFVIIPHERELRIYTAHIEVEWGIGQSVGDRISITLLNDGRAVTDPDSLVSTMQLTTWDWDTDLLVTNLFLTPDANSGVYKHQTSAGDARQPNAGLVIRATYIIDNQIIPFSRSMFNYV